MTHKEWVANVFDQTSALYGTEGASFFTEFAMRLVFHAKPKAQDQVLDVACGKGAQLLALSKTTTNLTGIDISPQMIEQANVQLQRQKIQAKLSTMDAEHLDFANGSFDLVTCGFGLFFFPHPEIALREFKRVLKPGGRIALSLWGPTEKHTEWVIKKAVELGAKKSLILHNYQEPKTIYNTLRDFSNIAIIQESHVHHFSRLESWWNSLWTHATRALFEQLSEKSLSELKEEAFAKFHCNSGFDAIYHVQYVLAKV